ncbi:hypothetical protein NHX12_022449, partial [Muraenolepis orangiensis]
MGETEEMKERKERRWGREGSTRGERAGIFEGEERGGDGGERGLWSERMGGRRDRRGGGGRGDVAVSKDRRRRARREERGEDRRGENRGQDR